MTFDDNLSPSGGKFRSWKVGATDRLADPVAFNALRFATYAEAGAYAAELESRWLGCKRTEIRPSIDAPTHRAELGEDNHGRATALESADLTDARTQNDLAHGRLILGDALADYRDAKMR